MEDEQAGRGVPTRGTGAPEGSRGDASRGDASRGEVSRGARLRGSLGRLGLAVAGVAVLGLMSGYLFATSAPERAAAMRISAFVHIEAVGAPAGELDTWDPAAPTGGDARGAAPCGERDAPLTSGAQVAALAAGRVLVQYRADVDEVGVSALRTVADGHAGEVILAPNGELADPVVATAWSRRMSLRAPEPDLLDAFATAYAGGGPAPTSCQQ